MKLGKKIDGYYNYTAKADDNEAQFGITPEYKFFDDKLNEIFCGGLSKPNATNIILIYGASGVGKSLFSLNVIASAPAAPVSPLAPVAPWVPTIAGVELDVVLSV